jgi:LemA protein
MDLLFIFILILIIVGVFLIIFIDIYNRFQTYIIKINEAESNIDAILRKRFDLLNRSISIIKGNVEIEGEVLELIVKLRSRKLTNFELDRQLYIAINEFNTYKENHEELGSSEGFIKICNSLSDSETELFALRKYYNDVITDYNKLALKIPSNIVAKVFKYKIKSYFDGKDMTDEIYDDFKL